MFCKCHDSTTFHCFYLGTERQIPIFSPTFLLFEAIQSPQSSYMTFLSSQYYLNKYLMKSNSNYSYTVGLPLKALLFDPHSTVTIVQANVDKLRIRSKGHRWIDELDTKVWLTSSLSNWTIEWTTYLCRGCGRKQPKGLNLATIVETHSICYPIHTVWESLWYKKFVVHLFDRSCMALMIISYMGY